jgi:hypothetical protein
MALDVAVAAPLTRYLCAYAPPPPSATASPRGVDADASTPAAWGGRARSSGGPRVLRRWVPTPKAVAAAARVQAAWEARLVDPRAARLEAWEVACLPPARAAERLHISDRVDAILRAGWQWALHALPLLTEADVQRIVAAINTVAHTRYRLPSLCVGGTCINAPHRLLTHPCTCIRISVCLSMCVRVCG